MDIHLQEPQLKTTVPNFQPYHCYNLYFVIYMPFRIIISFNWHNVFDLTVCKRKIDSIYLWKKFGNKFSTLTLTFLNMPEIKVVLDVVQLFPHVFTDRCMSVCYQSSNHQTTSQEICHAILESKELHGWAASCNIPLTKITWSIRLGWTRHTWQH